MPTPSIKRTRDGQTALFVALVPNNPNTVEPVIQPLERPNVTGMAFRKLAGKARPWSCRCMRDFDSEANARAAAQHLRTNLVGELCEIYTADGTGYVRMMCLEVVERDVRAIASCSGGLAATGGGGLIVFDFGGGAPAIAEFELVFLHVGPPTS